MLSLVQLRSLFEELGTPDAGRKVVEEARRSAPVRQVRSNSNNVITRFVSRKMGRMVDTESRTVEYPAVIMYEHDPKIIEYYAQPMKLDLKWKGPNDQKPSRIPHTPDFLLVREDGFWVEEWREEARLEALSAKFPGRYIKENGQWQYPAAEEYLRSLGISYRLRSAEEHPRIYIQNLIFLADYLAPTCPTLESHQLEVIQRHFGDQAAIPLLHLLERGRTKGTENGEGEGFTSDEVYKAIADQHLCFNLKEDLLSDTRRVMVYRDTPAMELGRQLEHAMQYSGSTEARRDVSIDQGCLVDYDGATYTIVRVGEKRATLQNKDTIFELEVSILATMHQQGIMVIHAKGEVTSRSGAVFEQLSPRAVEEILERMRLLELEKADSNALPASKKRTLQRYRKMMREAGDHLMDQRMALASRISARGNRQRKIPQRVIELVAKVAHEHYNTAANKNKSIAYRFFEEACKAEDLIPCSKMAFNKELEAHKSVRSRRGKRLAYQEEEPIIWYLRLKEPVHGVRPFQYVHIDHTQLDLLLVSPESRKSLGKPWLTLAIDAESREIVAFYLTFEAPSYRSCMMVLRDLVNRHGRMPAMLVLDNGKEFHSGALERVCRLYGCSLRYRPSGTPRFGTVVERMFGTTNQQFIHQLEGNTQLMKNPRGVTKAVLPENFAAWTLPTLHGALEYYFVELYGKTEHPAHGEEPTEHFRRKMEETGERKHHLVRFDDVFLIETCPPPPGAPTRDVDHQRGIKVSHLFFWNTLFQRPGMRGAKVEVRVDPWNPGRVFALVKGEWVACLSKLHPLLSKYTGVERRYLFEELAKQLGRKLASMREHRLAEWITLMDPKNFNPKLSEQQQQSKALYGALGMAHVGSGSLGAISEPATVVPLKTSEPQPRDKPSKRKSSVRSGITPLEVDNDDYSLL
ncbi:MAG TPA: DDE-type integrase/transposase/recombinase [Holophagaceae bacterium]|nr:DDE-type integrase/transposase/recombinase [Holophagaceae bacterium]